MPKEEQYHEDQWEAEDASWEADAPLLASLRREAPDDVPEGYFSGLPEQVMARIRAEEAAGAADSDVAVPVQSARPWKNFAWLGAVLLLSSLALFWWRPWDAAVAAGAAEEEPMATQLEQVDATDILKELELSDLSEEELYDMLGQEAQAALDEEFSEFSQENLLDYLDDADLDAAAWEAIDLNPDFFNEATQ